MKRLTIFGATGGVGRELVEQVLAAGHEVVAVARSPRGLPAGVVSFPIDLNLADPSALASAVVGADAVLSALGARSSREAGIAERGTRAIVEAMTAAGVHRLVVISAAPVATVPSVDRPLPPRRDPGDSFAIRTFALPILRRVFRRVYADLALMEDVVRRSGLAWTIIRPPRLVDRRLTGAYRTALDQNVPGGASIGRADLAHLMLRLLADEGSEGHSVGVGY